MAATVLQSMKMMPKFFSAMLTANLCCLCTIKTDTNFVIINELLACEHMHTVRSKYEVNNFAALFCCFDVNMDSRILIYFSYSSCLESYM